MRFEFELLKTLSRSKKGQGRLSLHIFLTSLAVSFGVFTVIIVLAGFDGYFQTMENLFVSSYPHIQVSKHIKKSKETDPDSIDSYTDLLEMDDVEESVEPRKFDTDEDLDQAPIDTETTVFEANESTLFFQDDSEKIMSGLRNIAQVEYVEPSFYAIQEISIFREDGTLLLETRPNVYGSPFDKGRTALEINKLIKDKSVFEQMEKLELNSGLGGVIFNKAVADILHAQGVGIGQTVLLSTSRDQRGNPVAKVRWVASYSGGLNSELVNVLILDLKSAKKLFETNNGFKTLSIKIRDIYEAQSVAEQIDEGLPKGYFTLAWNQSPGLRKVFSLLWQLRSITIVTLLLIILVAGFSIKNFLAMLVMEKGKQIAVLKAIGAEDGHIYKAVILLALGVGTFGMFIGVVIGSIGVSLVEHIQLQTLNELLALYQLDFAINWGLVSWLYVAVLAICVLFAIGPAKAAAKIMPLEGLQK